MQKLATRRGGKCLSKRYINTDTKLKWQCAKNHTWENTPYHIKTGQWCPTCSHINTANKLRSDIKEMSKLAARRKGKCLSKKYINTGTKLRWQCAKKHEWLATPDSIKRGSWCPKCSKN